MMYSKQEYDMVRRQTMQIEAEKRALLRFLLIVTSLLLGIAFLLLVFIYQRYSSADHAIKTAEAKIATTERQLQQTTRELAEKKAILEKNAAALSKQNAIIETVVPKMLSKVARDAEVGELAHAIFQQPGHMISLPSIPPDNVLRRYRIWVDGRPHSYVLVAGLVDGRWVLYSNLVKNQVD